MAEELGKIEKPLAGDYQSGRKLFFVPLLYGGDALPKEYQKKLEKFWEQVGEQIFDLSSKLGKVNHIFHELVAETGEKGVKVAGEINSTSRAVIEKCLADGAIMEAVEDADILSEFMDWSRCLYMGLQNPRVQEQVYTSYTDAAKKRNESIAKNIEEMLKPDEIGLLIMNETHQVRFSSDIQVFYVAPPALDEIKRWLREQDQAASKETG